ncbi:hypothetical protein PQR02_17860 [Paraburkholderia sediminicola]|uniref:Uncharacterized protein n=1 Tax=Paraburkholderia rhynchosiae TaxID=487049 RepID=A0ACC7N8S8_9BURK
MALKMITTAMAILQDDQPFDPAHLVFGRNFATELIEGSVGKEYSFENPVLPRTQTTLLIEGDPADYTADRMKVKPVPTVFTIFFSPSMTGIDRSTLEDLLHLGSGYWVDGNGKRWPGNDMGTSPPAILLHPYRYRALDQPSSRFPVDVELAFGDPVKNAAEQEKPTTPILLMIRLSRGYPILTPEEREQRRLDQQTAKREKYGMMDLRTGMLCPETGIWEGWTESGPTDRTVVWGGEKFGQAFTIPRHIHSWSPSVDARWMWLSEYDRERPFGA